MFYTICMKTNSSDNTEQRWQKTPVANLVRHVQSGNYYARIRVRGKLIWKSLKTDRISVAKLRLGDFHKEERQRAAAQTAVARGKMTFADALQTYRERLNGDQSLKDRAKHTGEERITALLKSWPDLNQMDVAQISKADGLAWAARFGKTASPSAFNNTIGTFELVLDIAVEAGARYDNPAIHIKRKKIRQKQLQLPSQKQFVELITTIRNGDGGWAERCADLVEFLAYSGCRKGEAARVNGRDCDFEKGEITVLGDPATGTKNWEIRRVPMIPDMRRLLERLQKERVKQNFRASRSCWFTNVRVRLTRPARNWHCPLSRITICAICLPPAALNRAWIFRPYRRWLGHKDGGALAMKVYGHLRDSHSTAMAQKVRFLENEQKTKVAASEKLVAYFSLALFHPRFRWS